MHFILLIVLSLFSSIAYAFDTQWYKQKSNTTEWLLGLDFIDVKNGWAVGTKGTILKTDDGGINWFKQPIDTSYTISDVDFINPDLGWICGYDGGGFIMNTTNGGLSWARQDSGNFLYSIHFITSTDGWAVGIDGIILKTTDGGSTWLPQTVPDVSLIYTSVFFIDELNGWISGQIPGVVLKTTDGGLSWLPQTSGIIEDEAINSVIFINNHTGWIAGYNMPDSIGVGVIKKTTDGGSTWIDQISGTEQYLLSISFKDSSNGRVVGGNGTILKTTNSGSTWSVEVSGTTKDLNKIIVKPLNKGWIVGEQGTILRRHVEGLNINVTININEGWNMISLPVSVLDNHKSLLFPSSQSEAFFYNGGYIINDSLDVGRGYWLKFANVQTVDISGLGIDSLTINLRAGWNLVGGISTSIPVQNIIQEPSNSIISLFGYDNGYKPATVIEATKAYWIKANRNCKITYLTSLKSNISKGFFTDITQFQYEELPPPAPDKIDEPVIIDALPLGFALHQNYPNPFNSSTAISFEISEPSNVKLVIYNILGQEISTLVNNTMIPGYYKLNYDFDLSSNKNIIVSNVLFCKLSINSVKTGKNLTFSRKMIHIK